MKTLLIFDKSLGRVKSRLVQNQLGAAAPKAGLTLTEQPAEAELVIVFGGQQADSTLNGKNAFFADVGEALSQPDALLEKAKSEATPYQASAAAAAKAPSSAASTGVTRVVAVTACPTGVAHTFMAAEAIETEAKKRGWWVKVETRGSVGAGNPITPEEVEQADVVIVAADIEVDLSKFAGKKMYRTSTGLALKKTAQELDKALAEATVYQPS
ncbi:fructose PTS transporter subunit IIB, partial [Lonsdalea britannica]|uniref:fructose PTS transporter subunit IIB n=1 Tax=Lonsdalea britannica TaxID=1082704 RepID=UPI001C38B55F